MDAKKRTEMLYTLNLTVVALVALVAIVGLAAIVLNGPGLRSMPVPAQEQTPTGNAIAAESSDPSGSQSDAPELGVAAWQPFSDTTPVVESPEGTYRQSCFDWESNTYYDC